MPLPFLLVGDHPSLPSGLGRILRELAQRFSEDASLDLDVRVVGCRPEGSGPDGHPDVSGMPVWSFTATEDLGEGIAQHVRWAWERWYGQQPGVVLTIWDAARIHALTQQKGPWSHWGYVPVDGAMPGGTWLGPPAEAVRSLDRVLAYGAYGSMVLRGVVGTNVDFLPHGLDARWWQMPEQSPAHPERRKWIGCVMTNQPRKDWGLALATLAILRDRGHRVKLWAHTDRVVGEAWSLPQLVDLYRLGRAMQVTLSGDGWSDTELRAAYQRCGVIVLPSLGEGFGYPLVEALACGMPAVHSTDAGGAELLPRPEWKAPHRATRIEGLYGIERPVYDPVDWANAIERTWQWQDRWADGGVGYCQGSVAHLRWESLYPSWRSWVRQGLRELED